MAEDAGNIALFCDLVGTLIKMDEHRELPLDVSGAATVELLPKVADRLRPMRNHLIFVVTNQAGIARGRLTLETVENAIATLDRKLGGILTAWQICPHDDSDGCDCRKPKGGMITELARTYGVDLAGSTAVGDQEIDRLAAQSAGVGKFVFAREFFAGND